MVFPLAGPWSKDIDMTMELGLKKSSGVLRHGLLTLESFYDKHLPLVIRLRIYGTYRTNSGIFTVHWSIPSVVNYCSSNWEDRVLIFKRLNPKGKCLLAIQAGVSVMYG